MDKCFHLVESKGMPRISMYFHKVLLPLIFKITVHLCVYVHVYTCLRAEEKIAIVDSLLSIHGFLHQTHIVRHSDEHILAAEPSHLFSPVAAIFFLSKQSSMQSLYVLVY